MKIHIYYVIFLLFTNICVSQTINGSVVDDSTKRPLFAYILVRDSLSTNSIKEYEITNNGKFFFELKKEYSIIIIEIKSANYNSEFITIDHPNKNKTYSFSFSLTTKNPEELSEVIIKAKKKPYTIKKDTISYNVASYLDGSERKIQDVIKKLPGIEVNESSGEIKYKGKSIETVTLDGDNLFDKNYTIGTRNINVDIVEKIEAIDNYNENILLKDFNNGKVALNLKLKKGKADFSLNTEFSTGIFNNGKFAGGFNGTLLALKDSYKSFITGIYNNIGIDNSLLENTNNQDRLKLKKIIPEISTSNIFGGRSNINNQFLGSYNSIIKISNRLSTKVNFNYLNDEIQNNNSSLNNFIINNEEFITSDEITINKSPEIYKLDFELKYNTSRKSLLEYNLNFNRENISTPRTTLRNFTDVLQSNLLTNNDFFEQNLLFTKKASERSVLLFSFTHSLNDLSQNLNISPSIINDTFNTDDQIINSQKNYLSFKSNYLFKKNDRFDYNLTLGADYSDTSFSSALISRQNNISENRINNNFDYLKQTLIHTGNFNLNFKKLKLTPIYSLSILNQELKTLNSNPSKDTQFLFEPRLRVNYQLNQYSFFRVNASYNLRANAEDRFFSNQILTDTRTIVQNIPDLRLQRIQNYGLFYINNNLNYNFQFNTGINYRINKGSFFSRTDVSSNSTFTEFFFLPQNNSTLNYNLSISKYIDFISTTIKFNSNYSLSNSRNIINESNLRTIKNQFLSQELFFKSAFEFPLNFENSFTWNQNISESDVQSFTNNSIENNFKLLYKPSKFWFFSSSLNYFLPSLDNRKNDFIFLDARVRYRTKNRKFDISLIGNNLINENNFQQIQTSDISTNIFQSNILQRHLLINFAYSF
ncbi:TonB-dependent receptor [Winogradskyella immobilis]|uniref:TonB-dependent receptor n=1 Tax=Winogradskyella immobilis TaxID=2816852 RepID=A0ABS8EQY0_9FLAO|nr:hypothetical protein [Winogradskyella immobilis]MCC1485634.1 TonB-dependent receptor [Winogradskyella immobilis]MCG0017726.1 hypothetical protein [Winogradskyella immobilis]